MPQVLSYPGVYIEELPSAVHTITGVATSIAAFVGWAPRGSVSQAVLVQSWMDFAREFGGLDSRSYLGYAVNQFFGNGGQQAYIVRLVDSATALTAKAPNVGGSLNLFATSPGQWANTLQVSVAIQKADPTRFSIQVQMAGTGGQPPRLLETFVNLSVSPTDPQYVVNVIDSDSQYITFVDPSAPGNPIPAPAMPTAVTNASFTPGNDGKVLVPGDGTFENALDIADALSPTPPPPTATGLSLLNRVDIFNLLCVPGETDVATIGNLEQYCFERRAMYIVDPPKTATTAALNTDGPAGISAGVLTPLSGQHPENAAYYYPWVQAPDPLFGNRPSLFPPCGFVAGIYASTDASRGVWKAPAGIGAGLSGDSGLQYVLTDEENGLLNVQAINCLRQFKVFGNVVWGSRTLQGADQFGSQWKYVPIRRMALFVEGSLYNGTQWVVFEPNDETLWGQIRLNVGAFMQGLFLQGAFQGTRPQQAYFVKCDAENNPQSSINLGIVNILVGFAPLYPAEFVVIQIQQMAGQTLA
jgi:phage tail sheath protein FI